MVTGMTGRFKIVARFFFSESKLNCRANAILKRNVAHARKL